MYPLRLQLAPRGLFLLPLLLVGLATCLVFTAMVRQDLAAFVCASAIAVALLIAALCAAVPWGKALRRGWSLELGDQLTIDRWPFGRRTYAWPEIGKFERFGKVRVIADPLFWLPHVSQVAQHFVAFVDLPEFEPKTVADLHFRIAHTSGQILLEFHPKPTDAFPLLRWLDRRTLVSIVEYFGGAVTFSGEQLVAISLSGTSISHEAWSELKERIHAIAGITRIDLSATQLDDEALAGLEFFPSLEEVATHDSAITPAASRALNDTLRELRSRGAFHSVAHIEAPQVSFEFLKR